MENVNDEVMAGHFIAWQCRLRQIAMRDGGGRPSPGMTPQLSLASGEVLMPALTVLVVPRDPEETTTFFEFQARKSNDPRQVYEAGLKFLQADYFHKPARFEDRVVAQFGGGSQAAERLIAAEECLLTFEQFSQVWILACTASRLHNNDPARAHVLAHNRLFNPKMAPDTQVLSFQPVWGKAQAQPMPPGLG